MKAASIQIVDRTDARRRRAAAILLLPGLMLLAAFGPGVIHAQARAPVTIDVASCIELTSDLERYDCYERLVAAALDTRANRQGMPTRPSAAPAAAAASAPAPAAPSAATPAAATTSPPAAARSGATVAAARAPVGIGVQANARSSAPETDEPQEFVATITEIDEFLPNRVRVTLDNGQIWRQTQTKRYQLRAGYEVRIYPSRWGDDFRLSATGVNGFIQVERVR